MTPLELNLPNSITMSLQWIPPGSFRMGSRGFYVDEEPAHVVQVTHGFYVGTYPVTQEQFALFRPDHKNEFPGKPDHPAESVSWEDAMAYCAWLTEYCAPLIPDGFRAALPSEAQWEYACRAGTDTEYYSGDGEAALVDVGWYAGNSQDSTQPVGTRAPNGWGLYDMHGNVWEWCLDAWDEHAYQRRVDGVCDPFVEGNLESFRVLRGGSWSPSPWYCRAAYRYWGRPSHRVRYLGFRVCLVPGPCPGKGEAEPASGGVARRDDAAKPQRSGEAGLDLRRAKFPPKLE